ncbi:hypothetical protein JCM8097_007027 [Rhodosporidiobolus ruineniae]
MTEKKTPVRFAQDRTNLPSRPSTSSSSSSSTSRPFPPSRPSSAQSWRQSTLADSFLRSSSPLRAPGPPASTPATSVAGDATGTRGVLFGGEGEMEEDEGEGGMSDKEREERRRGKRRRVEPGSDDFDHLEQDDEEEEEDEPVALFRPCAGQARLSPTHNVAGRQMSAFEAMKRRELGFRAGRGQVSMRPWLRTMASNNEEDVVRLPSTRPDRNFAPPFALAFTNAAKQGGKKIVAVGDEEGSVSFLSAEKERWTRGPTRHSFKAHDNAIFDLRWSQDDELLATAGGDQTVRLWDVRTQACVGILAGHTCTVKNVSWDPSNPHMLSTASRDGTIRVWDRRVQAKYSDEHGELGVATVNHIKNAHGLKGKGSKGRSATRSVTAVTYLAHQPNLLASSGSADSVIKIWDLRRSHSRRVNPATYETNEDSLLHLEAAGPAARPHGIASMALAPDGRRLYAQATDSRIHAFTPLNLTLPSPVRTFLPPPSSKFSSFYVRCAVSPCSRYLAAGSSDGGLVMWDTEGSGTSEEAVVVRGHEREVSGVDWCAGEGLATCSDDLLVRYWQPQQHVSRLRTACAAGTVDDDDAYEALRAKERWSGEDIANAAV